MEIAKFILTAFGTFLSVFGLSFTIFQYWRKKQEEKFSSLKTSLEGKISTEKTDREKEMQKERSARERDIENLTRKVERLENTIVQGFESRLSEMNGLLKGMRSTLDKIQDWFISNSRSGG
jgi:flagellar motility protein MotE (MotC chaperone)